MQKEWQCYYCGRFMRDVRAVFVVKDLPYTQKIHACPVCNALVPLGRAKTLQGRQEHIRKTLGPIVGLGKQVVDRSGHIEFVQGEIDG